MEDSVVKQVIVTGTGRAGRCRVRRMAYLTYPSIPCRICGQPSRVKSKRLCNLHYRRWQKYGNPERMEGLPNGERLEQVRAALGVDTSECITDDRTDYTEVRYRSRRMYMHRLVCSLSHGEPHEGHQACHSCNVRACINPRHLRWGTARENSHDRLAHGTLHRGELVNGAKLREEQVYAIRDDERTHTAIANDYGVSRRTVGMVKARVRWGWLPERGTQ